MANKKNVKKVEKFHLRPQFSTIWREREQNLIVLGFGGKNEAEAV